MAEKLLYSIPEAAKALSLGRSSIYRLINDGALAVVRLGRRTLIRAASIRRLAGEDGANDAATT
jgi:excisionase family DNA binding protein